MKKIEQHCLLTAAALLALTMPACSQMGTGEKLGAILLTAGIAGHAIEKKENAEAAAVVAGSLAATGIADALIIERKNATSEQVRTAEANAEKAYSQMSDERRASLKKDGVRYLSVDTVRSDASRGQKNIMVYDTAKRKMSSKTAYDVRVAPEKGERVKFDTIITEYVGGVKD